MAAVISALVCLFSNASPSTTPSATQSLGSPPRQSSTMTQLAAVHRRTSKQFIEKKPNRINGTGATAKLSAASVGYYRSLNVFGRSGNIAVSAPYIKGSAEGKLAGQFGELERSGLPDPRIRFAVNLKGAQAMSLREFAKYRQKTNIGASLVAVMIRCNICLKKFISIWNMTIERKPFN